MLSSTCRCVFDLPAHTTSKILVLSTCATKLNLFHLRNYSKTIIKKTNCVTIKYTNNREDDLHRH